MTRPPIAELLVCRRGTSVVEMALLAPVFFGLLFGVVNLSFVMWTQASLNFAAEAAARCASVDKVTCSTQSAIQTYALNQYMGQPIGSANPFVYSASGCGNTVTASYTYSLSIPFYGDYSVPLSANACFP